MWHPVRVVAKNFSLDPDALIKFAIDNASKYCIIDDYNSVMVNTWFCNNLIEDFKAFGGST